MKAFLQFSFDASECLNEVHKFRKLLEENVELSENKDILPFFKKNQHLSAFIASYVPSISKYDLLAYEYDLFGDFAADLVVGDSRSKNFLFVEFEDAKKASVFKKTGGRSTPDWANRVEHGISQIIDWFWKLNDFRQTQDFENRFGARKIRAHGLVVVGRNGDMSLRERERLKWREESVLCDSKHIEITTFDDLLDDLGFRLQQYKVKD
ncbi:DUF4263 domain-containing protein [candidate division KSB1 bacterium]|nr:DUF4263 domain-containing protein [candidate division KSB1 bacterium]